MENAKKNTLAVLIPVCTALIGYGIGRQKPIYADAGFYFGIPLAILIFMIYQYEFGFGKVIRILRGNPT